MAIDDESFGLGTQDLWVDSAEFASHTGSGWAHTGFGYRYNNTGAPIMDFIAPIDLPAGARITAITCYFYDIDATQNALVTLHRSEYNSATNVPGGGQIGGFIQSVGTLGYQPSTVTYNETVRRREGTVSYFYSLGAHMTAANTLRLRGCWIRWNRQVSPAPATATFSDVPTSHPYFRFVEALVDSGISSGCGGGLYCVNNPVTRGEMAVFLAVALGLHFPF
jgi:hypothetical protein